MSENTTKQNINLISRSYSRNEKPNQQKEKNGKIFECKIEWEKKERKKNERKHTLRKSHRKYFGIVESTFHFVQLVEAIPFQQK